MKGGGYIAGCAGIRGLVLYSLLELRSYRVFLFPMFLSALINSIILERTVNYTLLALFAIAIN